MKYFIVNKNDNTLFSRTLFSLDEANLERQMNAITDTAYLVEVADDYTGIEDRDNAITISTTDNTDEVVTAFTVVNNFDNYNHNVDVETMAKIKEYCEVTEDKCENYFLMLGCEDNQNVDFRRVRTWIDALKITQAAKKK